MPFSGPGDPSLPPHVKKLSPNKRSQWVHVFNSALRKCNKEGGSNCEGIAMKKANGVAKASDFASVFSKQEDRSKRFAIEITASDAPAT
ncbi:MAG: hypothetical protein QQN63_13975, partial [Nitrosopumilus sp.]